MQIKYMKHPVSAEEKKKLNAEGYRIIDERFAPEEEKPAAKIKRTRVKV